MERAGSPLPPGPHVVLIGPMGCGKTTVGRLVADRLGRQFVDNDDALEAQTGANARRIEAEFGTAELHRHERHVFERALAGADPAVIAAAASVVDTVAVEQMEPHLVVYLRCTPPVGSRRSIPGLHRPEIRSTTQEQARRDRRAQLLADLVVAVDEIDAQQAADRIGLVDLTALSRRIP